MKYYKSNGFLKSISSTGVVSISACVLITVGAISWFALSRNKDNDAVKTPSENDNQSYTEQTPSYNYDTAISEVTPPAEDVNDTVSDIPYSSEQQPSKPQADPQSNTQEGTETIKYVLPIKGSIIKGYSDSALQYSATYDDMRLHTGIDIACELGSEIKSATSGTVKSVVDDAVLGKVITIDHTGELTAKYCGFKEVKVKEGDNVKAGDIIGLTGEIPGECADKPHIHIEVLAMGKHISPLDALKFK